jgi:CRISPR-associated protein Cmr1
MIDKSVKEVNLEFKLLTPFWTGGPKMQMMQKIEESSMLGALRWWHHVLLNDNLVCNCQVKNKGDQESICPTCRIFGTTGWSRRFNLKINGDEAVRWPRVERIIGLDNRSWFMPRERVKNTFLFSLAFNGRQGFTEAAFEVCYLFYLVSCLGSFGGKTAAGCGVIDILNKESVNITEGKLRFLEKYSGRLEAKNNLMNDFFCIEVECNGLGKEASANLYNTSPVIRQKLRAHLRSFANIQGGDSKLKDDLLTRRHNLMGYAKGKEVIGSSIRVTNPYDCEKGNMKFRIYGWATQEDNKKFDYLFKVAERVNLLKWELIINNALKEKLRLKDEPTMQFRVIYPREHSNLRAFLEGEVNMGG